MEHPGITAMLSQSLGHDHIAELRQGGVGENFLDVILLQRHEGGNGCCKCTDVDDRSRCPGRSRHEIGNPGQHKNPGCHHRRGVDQGRNGSGALHGIGQPDVKRNLGGFADRSAENQNNREIEQEIVGHGADRILYPVKVESATEMPDEENPDHETKITDPVSEKSLLGGIGGRGFFIPVTDQDIGTHPDEFPENEHHDKVVCQDDARHREHEESQAREIARFPFIISHVSE